MRLEPELQCLLNDVVEDKEAEDDLQSEDDVVLVGHVATQLQGHKLIRR